MIDYEIGISCFSYMHTALMTKSKDWLDCKQDNVSEFFLIIFAYS